MFRWLYKQVKHSRKPSHLFAEDHRPAASDAVKIEYEKVFYTNPERLGLVNFIVSNLLLGILSCRVCSQQLHPQSIHHSPQTFESDLEIDLRPLEHKCRYCITKGLIEVHQCILLSSRVPRFSTCDSLHCVLSADCLAWEATWRYATKIRAAARTHTRYTGNARHALVHCSRLT